MFPRAIRILGVGGVDVRVDPSWVIVALLVGWSFLSRFGSPGRATVLALAMAVGGTLAFFMSVLVHELAHALEGRHRGLDAHAVTLFLFGGVTELRADSERPRDEFVIAAVGPYASLVCAAAFGLLATALSEWGAPALAPLAELAGLLGWLNVGLALFNLVPGAPLDGGRVLRATLWALTRDRGRAMRWSAWAGQTVAVALLALAVRAVLGEPAAIFQGLWLGVIGLFLWQGARSDLRQGETERLMAGRDAHHLAQRGSPHVPGDAPLTTVADVMLDHPDTHLLAVNGDDGMPVAFLHVDDVAAVPANERPTRTAAGVARPLGSLPTVSADASLAEVVRLVTSAPAVVITHGGRIAAVVDESQVEAALQRLAALDRRPSPRRSRPPATTT